MSDCRTLGLCTAAQVPMSKDLLDGCGAQELQLGTAQAYTSSFASILAGLRAAWLVISQCLRFPVWEYLCPCCWWSGSHAACAWLLWYGQLQCADRLAKHGLVLLHLHDGAADAFLSCVVR